MRPAAALLVLVGAASLAGALVGHALWQSAQRSVTIARTPPAAATSAGSTAATGVSSALVNVNTEYAYGSAAGAGTGIVVSSDGRVVTNNHVIRGATTITATDVGNGKTYDATVVGYDLSKDVAVLQLEGASGLATAKIGDSSTASVGDAVVGIGNAGGEGGLPSSASGTITALDQSITAADENGGSEELSGLIQTNADIQPGDSGGALVDSGGRVIGMNTAGSSGFRFQETTTAAYAIPIDQVMATEAQISSGKSSGTVHIGDTAFLGVGVAPAAGGGFGDPFGDGTSTAGVQVASVVDGKPAQQAGLTAGDVITAVGGRGVDSPNALSSAMVAYHPGDKLSLAWTDTSGAAHTATVELASGPPA